MQPHGIDRTSLPKHIAVIMDGNGRWAEKRGLPRMMGHREGVASIEAVTRACGNIGIPHLTVYAFSTENWLRPKMEVEGLMKLFCETLLSMKPKLLESGIRLTFMGRRAGLSPELLSRMDDAVSSLSKCSVINLNIALNYGARQELVDAVAAAAASGRKFETEQDISDFLYSPSLPDPDLIIRTSGEQRLSNFMLWQAAYSEFYFTDVFWPDFREEQLYEAVRAFQARKRRFGKV